ncbi:hypothetical protein ABT160_34160 [Streptomyces sp. NPDC001941]|uniref:ATP-dependent DNA ligase n=1 Tax=Streptomyces sp. NPDC001941 TaxID=3154659 RepID=UPI00332FC9A2
MEMPVAVALARSVTALPTGPDWWFEPKFDGHRVVLLREPDAVRLQARSGRLVTAAWNDLAAAGEALPAGTVLDGEAVVWREGRTDFGAVQARANSTPARARELARQWPASYAVWDLLAHPVHGDVRPRPYTERRALLLDVLSGLGPPIQPVPATDDRETALVWYENLLDQGIEGVVAKRGSGAYRAGRIWQKVRHAETVDAAVIGYTGPADRADHLVVRLPDGRRALSQRLTAPLAARVSGHLHAHGPGRAARTDEDEPYRTTGAGLVVEVLAGTTRHTVVTVTRVR